MELKGSRTEECLKTAFAGESQARNKYTFWASVAKKEGYEQIAAIFLETADNEKEHAKKLFRFLGGINDTPQKKSLRSLKKSAKWKKNTTNAIPSCSKHCRKVIPSCATANRNGIAATVVMSTPANPRRKYARAACTRKHSLKFSRKTIKIVYSQKAAQQRRLFLFTFSLQTEHCHGWKKAVQFVTV